MRVQRKVSCTTLIGYNKWFIALKDVERYKTKNECEKKTFRKQFKNIDRGKRADISEIKPHNDLHIGFNFTFDSLSLYTPTALMPKNERTVTTQISNQKTWTFLDKTLKCVSN